MSSLKTSGVVYFPYTYHHAEERHIALTDLYASDGVLKDHRMGETGAIVTAQDESGMPATFNLESRLSPGSLLYVTYGQLQDLRGRMGRVDGIYFDRRYDFGVEPGSKQDIPLEPLLLWDVDVDGMGVIGSGRHIRYDPESGKFHRRHMAEAIERGLEFDGVKPKGAFILDGNVIGYNI